ncbi:GntR family transcriptional regulator [Helicobacter sp. 12S02232-10]|uniref:GntR family transcriptional regulator n=1 Tax=Helicobacter sp. 12S02232-10 TaxID=1476197 RepID=UPI000BCAF576|nr:GntR family transcriptional regulator [Helicobacter sp. 12S02232-10]PAF48263.1 GntR family transcriptional regulator [Helicobacter sp. 12S02232-10]
MPHETKKAMNSGEQAYRYIIESIKNATLLPGCRIRENDLVQTIGLSRTPIREAINLLINEGLITNDQKRGFIITELDQNMIAQLYEMREVLEGAAARLAAQHASDVEISILENIVEDQTRAKTLQDIAKNNKIFHSTLYQCAHNKFLLKTIQELENSLLLLGSTTLKDPQRQLQSHQEHLDILNALKNRNLQQAKECAEFHIRQAYKIRLDRFLLKKKLSSKHF